MDTAAVNELACDTFELIIKVSPAAVLCQGESVYVFHLVTMLKTAGIMVLAACSERMVKEKRREDGAVEKVSEFVFVFSEYQLRVLLQKHRFYQYILHFENILLSDLKESEYS